MSKSPDAFRTISEVAELLETPAHVLRFWESRFPQIRPVKRAGGRRYYRPADVALLGGIKRLLHDEGLTIRGVQKLLREQGVRHVSGMIDETSEAEDDAALVAALAASSGPGTAPQPLPPAAVESAQVIALETALRAPAVPVEDAATRLPEIAPEPEDTQDADPPMALPPGEDAVAAAVPDPEPMAQETAPPEPAPPVPAEPAPVARAPRMDDLFSRLTASPPDLPEPEPEPEPQVEMAVAPDAQTEPPVEEAPMVVWAEETEDPAPRAPAILLPEDGTWPQAEAPGEAEAEEPQTDDSQDSLPVAPEPVLADEPAPAPVAAPVAAPAAADAPPVPQLKITSISPAPRPAAPEPEVDAPAASAAGSAPPAAAESPAPLVTLAHRLRQRNPALLDESDRVEFAHLRQRALALRNRLADGGQRRP